MLKEEDRHMGYSNSNSNSILSAIHCNHDHHYYMKSLSPFRVLFIHLSPAIERHHLYLILNLESLLASSLYLHPSSPSSTANYAIKMGIITAYTSTMSILTRVFAYLFLRVIRESSRLPFHQPSIHLACL